MKKNDTVKYISPYRCANPHSHLIIGNEYQIEKIKVECGHESIKLYNKIGWFDANCFIVIHNKLNSLPQYSKTMDPSTIVLESTAKMFEYEKLSREIENCGDLEELKNMCRCFVKLHLKHQEVSASLFKM